MDVFLRIDTNIIAMILLGIVFIIANHRLDRQDLINKKFLGTSWIILLEIFLETMTCIINKHPGQFGMMFSVLLHMALFITAPILTSYWYFFVHRLFKPDAIISKTKRIFLLIPVVVNTIMTIFSPIYGWVFVIDRSNVYHRGSYFMMSFASIYIYLFFSLLTLLKHKKNMMKQEFLPLFTVSVFPIIGGICQAVWYGVLLMWSSTAFSLVIIYIFLQQRMIHLDSLTGAWTRGSFENYLSQRIRKGREPRFGAIFLDLDGLKQINDEYGHLEGDDAIKTTIKLIRSFLRRTDIIARWGGDEFIIIIDCNASEVLEQLIERIKMKLAEYNLTSGKEYELKCSFGADMYDERYENMEEFLKQIDHYMYLNKKKKYKLANT